MRLSGDKTFLEKEVEALFEEISFEDLRQLRDWLRDCDPVGDWPVEERLERMRSKVMKEIYLDTNSRKV